MGIRASRRDEPTAATKSEVGEKLCPCIQAFSNKLLALDRYNYPVA
jgi:hypothetical protein